MKYKFTLTYQGDGYWMLRIVGHGWYMVCPEFFGCTWDDPHTIRCHTFEELIIHVPEILKVVWLVEDLVLKGVI